MILFLFVFLAYYFDYADIFSLMELAEELPKQTCSVVQAGKGIVRELSKSLPKIMAVANSSVISVNLLTTRRSWTQFLC